MLEKKENAGSVIQLVRICVKSRADGKRCQSVKFTILIAMRQINFSFSCGCHKCLCWSVRRFRDKHPRRMNQEIKEGNLRWWWIIVRNLVAMSLLTIIAFAQKKMFRFDLKSNRALFTPWSWNHFELVQRESQVSPSSMIRLRKVL